MLFYDKENDFLIEFSIIDPEYTLKTSLNCFRKTIPSILWCSSQSSITDLIFNILISSWNFHLQNGSIPCVGGTFGEIYNLINPLNITLCNFNLILKYCLSFNVAYYYVISLYFILFSNQLSEKEDFTYKYPLNLWFKHL